MELRPGHNHSETLLENADGFRARTRFDEDGSFTVELMELDPVDAPDAALAGAGAGNLTEGEHAFSVTFVTADGESSPSPLSGAVEVLDNTDDGKIDLTGIPLGSARCTARKVYMTKAADPAGTAYLLTTLADNTTTIYTANTADAGLGAVAPTMNTAIGVVLEVDQDGAATLAASKATAYYDGAGLKILGAQGAAVADAAGGAVIDVEARAALNALLARVRAHGLIAT